MKIQYKFRGALTLLAITLLATSCDDFLDKKPSGYQTDKNSYNTIYKMQSSLNAVYDVLQTETFNDSDWRFGDATSDDVEGADEGLSSQMGQLVNFRFTTNNTYIRARWKINYDGIHRANQVISNISKVELSTTQYYDYQTVRYILGQAKFLRALYYFNLVKTFGGVPIYPETADVDNLVVPRSSISECYAYIERDLREAIVLLPAKFIDNEAGKAGAGSAVGLLMKVLMYQAVPGEKSQKWEEMVRLGEYMVEGKPMTIRQVLKWEENYPGVEWEEFRRANYYKPKDLTEAADEPYETLDDELPFMVNYYTLQYKDYYNNAVSYVEQFYHNAEFSSNSVFEIVFKESADGSAGDANEGCSVYEHLVAGNYYWATKAVVLEIFGSTDGRGQNPQILGHSEYASDGQRVEPGSGRFVSGKWYTPLAERPQYMYDNGKNRRWMRYSEVVLMYAEALNESGLPARALDQLNSVKAQANTINNNSELYKAGGYSLMRDNIWKERRAELSFEFDRFFDIVRQGRAASVLHAFGAPRVNRRGLYFIEGVNEVFPIPQNEVDLSNGVIAQNPGY